MSSNWGKNIKVSIFGESHGTSVGMVVDGFPSGINLDIEAIKVQMARRAPFNQKHSTTRVEKDEFEFQSGIVDDVTTGTPICAIIKNTNQHSGDYENLRVVPRPGHADFTANARYKGFQDVRGGGHFSGRLTAPMNLAGAICIQLLEKLGIKVVSKIVEIAGEKDDSKWDVIVDSARNNKDSVGGIIETFIYGMPIGVGNPIFENIESVLSSILFSIPAVKGVEFGAGFDLAKMYGSEANDEFIVVNNEIKTKTNNCGGILGGISNGMPISVRIAFKPTPSIFKPQQSVNIIEKCDQILEIKGRHDPCVVFRALPVVEGMCAIAVSDLMIDHLGYANI